MARIISIYISTLISDIPYIYPLLALQSSVLLGSGISFMMYLRFLPSSGLADEKFKISHEDVEIC